MPPEAISQASDSAPVTRTAELLLEHAATRLDGPLLVMRREIECGLHESVEVIGPDDRPRLGQVVALSPEAIVIDIHESSRDLPLAGVRTRFHGAPLSFGVGPDLLGRILDGSGRPIDGGPPLAMAE